MANTTNAATTTPGEAYLAHVTACPGCTDHAVPGAAICEEGAALREAIPYWEIEVAMEVRPSHVDEEDGEQRYHDVYFVTATSSDGMVYKHRKLFTFAESGNSYDVAVARANALAKRVQNAPSSWAGPDASPHWTFYRIVYGSAAYCRNQDRLEAETELADRTIDMGSAEAHRSLPWGMQAALLNPLC